MTDAEFILDVLGDGEEHSLAEILTRSMDDRGCGLTVHSRVAELRKKGYAIEHLTVKGAERGHAHTYRLISAPAPAAALDPGPSGEGSDRGNASEVGAELTLFADARPSAYREIAA